MINIVNRWIDYHKIIITFILLCSVCLPSSARSNEQTIVPSVIGSWVAEPELGQLGLNQVSYTFRQDGSFSQKLDMISFCSRKPDCEYVWFVMDGEYIVSNTILKLRLKKMVTILKLQGQTVPTIREDNGNPMPVFDEFMIVKEHDKLMMTDKQGHTHIFLPSVQK